MQTAISCSICLSLLCAYLKKTGWIQSEGLITRVSVYCDCEDQIVHTTSVTLMELCAQELHKQTNNWTSCAGLSFLSTKSENYTVPNSQHGHLKLYGNKGEVNQTRQFIVRWSLNRAICGRNTCNGIFTYCRFDKHFIIYILCNRNMRVDSGLFYNSAMLSKKCYFTFTFFPLLSVRVRVHAISAGLFQNTCIVPS